MLFTCWDNDYNDNLPTEAFSLLVQALHLPDLRHFHLRILGDGCAFPAAIFSAFPLWTSNKLKHLTVSADRRFNPGDSGSLESLEHQGGVCHLSHRAFSLQTNLTRLDLENAPVPKQSVFRHCQNLKELRIGLAPRSKFSSGASLLSPFTHLSRSAIWLRPSLTLTCSRIMPFLCHFLILK